MFLTYYKAVVILNVEELRVSYISHNTFRVIKSGGGGYALLDM